MASGYERAAETDIESEESKRRRITKRDDPGTGMVAGAANVEARTVVGVFDTRDEALSASAALEAAGFQGSMIAEQPPGTAPEVSASRTEANQGTLTGALIGGMIGAVVGLLVSFIPNMAWLFFNPLVSMAMLAGIGAVFGGLAGSFRGLGIPTAEAEAHEAAVRAGGQFLTIKVESHEQSEQVKEILRAQGVRSVDSFQESL